MEHTRVVSLNARQAKPEVHLVDTTRVPVMTTRVLQEHQQLSCQREKYYDGLSANGPRASEVTVFTGVVQIIRLDYLQ